MQLNKAETLIAQLAILLEADKTTKKEELVLLASIANQFKIDKNRILEIIANKDFADFSYDQNEVKRAENLYTLIFMTKVDGHIHKKEAKSLIALGVKMGFRKEMIEELIEKATQSKDQLSPDYFTKAIKRYNA